MNDFQPSSRTLRLPRHGHNLSHTLNFTSSFGHLLPVYFDFLTPGDEVSIRPELFTRTQPLTSPALVDIDEYVECFFVPARKLNSQANELFVNVDDLSSSAFFNNATGNLFNNTDYIFPTLDLKNLALRIMDLDYLGSGDGYDNYSKSLGRNYTLAPSRYGAKFDSFQRGMFRLFDMFGLDPSPFVLPLTWQSIPQADKVYPVNLHKANNVSTTTYSFAPFVNIGAEPFLCYQAIYNDYYRLSMYEGCDVLSFNVDKGYTLQAENGIASNFSICGPYNPTNPYSLTPNDDATYGFSAKATSNWQKIFMMRYRALNHDYFTSLKVSPLSGSVGVLNTGSAQLSSENINQWLNNYADAMPFGHAGAGSLGPGYNATDVFISNSGSASSSSPAGALSVASIRTMFAVEKLLKILGRNGKHFDDQVLARFGVKVPTGYSNEVSHFGTFHQTINIGEVVSQSDTSQSDGNGSPLGALAGRGVGYKENKRRFKFKAPVYGFIMAIYSAVPRVKWISNSPRIFHYKRRYSYPTPEFDQLGAQPLYNGESILPTSIPIQNYRNLITSGFSILGWQKRWLEYKARFDRATHAFEDAYTTGSQNGAFRDWTIAHYFCDAYTTYANILGSLLCSPVVADQIFLQGYQNVNVEPLSIKENAFDMDDLPNWSTINMVSNSLSASKDPRIFDVAGVGNFTNTWAMELYASDPLIHELKLNVYKTSWLSSSEPDNV